MGPSIVFNATQRQDKNHTPVGKAGFPVKEVYSPILYILGLGQPWDGTSELQRGVLASS